jgi:hypothetical protein
MGKKPSPLVPLERKKKGMRIEACARRRREVRSRQEIKEGGAGGVVVELGCGQRWGRGSRSLRA